MRLYLDTCSLHRPLDERTQARIALEADAVLAILSLCEAGTAFLVASEPLALEVDGNPDPEKRAIVHEVLARAKVFAVIDEETEQRVRELSTGGFKTFDALHLAVAEAAQVDYFCTCDDRLLKRARGRSDLRVRVVSPLELAQEIVP
ncbi:MAG TPA: PIN domain-containing protein [Planctomycetaceae bacterium]